MKNIDKVRAYIKAAKDSGELSPGDKLPAYAELMEQFNISYQTISSIINKLDQEGLVEAKKGSGTYLKGGDRLKVLFLVDSTTLSFSNWHKLLRKYVANLDLNLDFDFMSRQEIYDFSTITKEGKYVAAITLASSPNTDFNLPKVSLAQFDDYYDVISELVLPYDQLNTQELPFASNSYQIGVNPKLLAEVGYKLEDLTADFSWWDDFTARCREKSILPASFYYDSTEVLLFRKLAPMLLSFSHYEHEMFYSDKTFFNNEIGELWLKLLRDSTLIFDNAIDSNSFFLGGAVFSWYCGSWLVTQNKSLDHPDKQLDDLNFLPYRTFGGEKISILEPESLSLYLKQDTELCDRQRVWSLLKILVSREFQMDFCGLSGMISAHQDILPYEYNWNRYANYSGFFKQTPDEKIIYPSLEFSQEQFTIFSILLENYRLYQASKEETLQRLDVKKCPKILNI